VLRKLSRERERERERIADDSVLNAIVIKTETKYFDIYRLVLWRVVPRMAAE